MYPFSCCAAEKLRWFRRRLNGTRWWGTRLTTTISSGLRLGASNAVDFLWPCVWTTGPVCIPGVWFCHELQLEKHWFEVLVNLIFVYLVNGSKCCFCPVPGILSCYDPCRCFQYPQFVLSPFPISNAFLFFLTPSFIFIYPLHERVFFLILSKDRRQRTHILFLWGGRVLLTYAVFNLNALFSVDFLLLGLFPISEVFH